MTTVKVIAYKESQLLQKISESAEKALTKALIDFIEILSKGIIEGLSKTLEEKSKAQE